jgi:sulfoxide reductase heme-binding subunit YedZ
VNTHLWWYVARSSGIVAWILVTAAVVWGLLLSLRLTKRPRPAWVLDLHRFLGGLGVAFVGVHLAGLVADSYTHFGPASLLMPLASAWRPVAVAWGVVAFYLLVAVELTSLMMRRLPRRIWHAVHLSSYGVFALTTVHALTAGTDTTTSWARWFALSSCTVVGFLTLVRMLDARGRAEHPATRSPGDDRRVGNGRARIRA